MAFPLITPRIWRPSRLCSIWVPSLQNILYFLRTDISRNQDINVQRGRDISMSRKLVLAIVDHAIPPGPGVVITLCCLSLCLGGVVFFASRYNHVHYQHPICAALRVSPLDLHWIVRKPWAHDQARTTTPGRTTTNSGRRNDGMMDGRFPGAKMFAHRGGKCETR
jgi:hypothetical protein